MKYSYTDTRWKPKFDLTISDDFLKVLWHVILWPLKLFTAAILVIIDLITLENPWLAKKLSGVLKWCIS